MKIKSILSTLVLTAAAVSLLSADFANAQIRTAKGDQRGSGSRYDDASNWQQDQNSYSDRRGGAYFRRDEELVLPVGGELFGNHGGRDNGTFYIKREIKKHYPNINLQNYDLESVEVIGVSEARRSSNSTLTLEVSGRYQDQAVLESRGRGPRGMDTASLVARERAQDRGGVETWQIKFSAATKVQRVIVNLERERRGGNNGGHQRPRMQSMGVYSGQAFTRPLVISVGQWADSVELKGANGFVAVMSVDVIFANGDKKTLNMKGVLVPGQSLKDSLGAERRIRQVIISSMSAPDGKLELLVGTSGRR